MEIVPLAMAHDKQSLATSVFFSQFALYVDHLGIDSRFSPTKESLGMPQLEAALSITNMMNPHLFFFALSISFLVVALALPCIKPVGLLPCASKGIIFHLCLSRLVLERNKTHDREIAL